MSHRSLVLTLEVEHNLDCVAIYSDVSDYVEARALCHKGSLQGRC